MKNPNNRWSWKACFKNATSGAANGAATGALMGIIDPTGLSAAAGAGVGAAVGFVATMTGDAVGYLWDDVPEHSFASTQLYIFVIGFLIALPLAFAVVLFAPPALDRIRAVAAIAFSANLLASSSARLIDDIRVRMSHRREQDQNA